MFDGGVWELDVGGCSMVVYESKMWLSDGGVLLGVGGCSMLVYES